MPAAVWGLDLGQFGRLSKSRMMATGRGLSAAGGGPHREPVAGLPDRRRALALHVVSNTASLRFILEIIQYCDGKYLYVFNIDSPLYIAVVYCPRRFTYASGVGDC